MDTHPNNSDLIELLSSFVASKIKFLIVGGYAVAKYGEPRYTKDVDLWVDNSTKNSELVYKTLHEFGAPISSITPNFFTFQDHFLKLGREPMRVDIICGMQGLLFSDAVKRRKKGELFGVKVWFVSFEDLLKLKRLADRPQDRVDVAKLLEHRKLKSDKKTRNKKRT